MKRYIHISNLNQTWITEEPVESYIVVSCDDKEKMRKLFNDLICGGFVSEDGYEFYLDSMRLTMSEKFYIVTNASRSNASRSIRGVSKLAGEKLDRIFADFIKYFNHRYFIELHVS